MDHDLADIHVILPEGLLMNPRLPWMVMIQDAALEQLERLQRESQSQQRYDELGIPSELASSSGVPGAQLGERDPGARSQDPRILPDERIPRVASSAEGGPLPQQVQKTQRFDPL